MTVDSPGPALPGSMAGPASPTSPGAGTPGGAASNTSTNSPKMPAAPLLVTSPRSSSAGSEDWQEILLDLSEVYAETEEVHIDVDELYLLADEEPATYRDSAKEKQWEEAMSKELEAIEKDKTWSITELPAGHKLIGLKWVYKLKKDANDNVVKHKARLVAKGYV